jgi:hypothetical protein
MVKGHSFVINKLTGTLTMEQLLVQLIQKTTIQCAEDHRLIVSCLNGKNKYMVIGDASLLLKYYLSNRHQATRDRHVSPFLRFVL